MTGCEHGKPLTVPCVACQRLADEMARAFQRAVFFGEYDRDGYTPAERRMRERSAA